MKLVKEKDYGYLDPICFEMMSLKVNNIVATLVEMVNARVYIKRLNIFICTKELGTFQFALDDLLEECVAPTMTTQEIANEIKRYYEGIIHNIFFKN